MISFHCSRVLISYHGLATIIMTLIFFCTTETCIAARSEPQNTEFIKTSCGVTLYPDICYKKLSSYSSTIKTSPKELANAALSATLKSAQSASTMVVKLLKEGSSKPEEANAMRDCVENMRDSVDELQQSLKAMKDLEYPDFDMKMSNIQTWVSAALTDEDTCMDGFEGNNMNGKIKDSVRSCIVSVAQLTSNALALVRKVT